jgi:pyridoxamine 5'-phosphate oxidase family protein
VKESALGRLLAELMPDEPEVLGLRALMLLTEARRTARTDTQRQPGATPPNRRTCAAPATLSAEPEGGIVMSFTDEEIAYMRSQPIARVATVGASEQPDVVPLAFEFDGTYFWVGGVGPSIAGTRKFRNINAGNTLVALVIDDLISLSPFIARAMRVYGYAERPVERVGMVGPGLYSRITPTISWSWNLASEPAGDTWYEPRRTVHPVPA